MSDLLPPLDLDLLVSQIREAIMPLDEILVAYLYGSMVKGTSGVGRDVDVGILLVEGFDEPALYPAHVAGLIEGKMGLYDMVDIRVLNHQVTGFQYRVIKEGVLVLCRDEGEKVRYESGVVAVYLDIKPYLDHYDMLRERRMGLEG